MYGCVTVLVVVSKVLDVVMRLWSVRHNAPCSVLLESRTRGVGAVFWREGVRKYVLLSSTGASGVLQTSPRSVR